MLRLTYKELEAIVDDDFERFEVLWDDIPVGIPGHTNSGRPSDYIEDDGRQLRWFHFKDTATGIEYDFSYTWSPDWRDEFPDCFLGDPPAGIEFIEVSEINPPAPPAPEPAKVLTPEEIADAAVWAPYRQLEASGSLGAFAKGLVPPKRIKEIRDWMKNTKGWSMYDLRAKVIPVCVEFQIDQKSLWAHIQGWDKKK